MAKVEDVNKSKVRAYIKDENEIKTHHKFDRTGLSGKIIVTGEKSDDTSFLLQRPGKAPSTIKSVSPSSNFPAKRLRMRTPQLLASLWFCSVSMQSYFPARFPFHPCCALLTVFVVLFYYPEI